MIAEKKIIEQSNNTDFLYKSNIPKNTKSLKRGRYILGRYEGKDSSIKGDKELTRKFINLWTRSKTKVLTLSPFLIPL